MLYETEELSSSVIHPQWNQGEKYRQRLVSSEVASPTAMEW